MTGPSVAGLVVAGMAGVACATPASPESTVRLVAVTPPDPGGTAPDGGAPRLATFLGGITEGRVTVDLAPDRGPCGNPDACLPALQAGDIDIYRAAASELTGLFPELQVLDVPYLIETGAVAELVFTGAFFARLRDALLDRTGLRLMAVSNAGGWRSIANDTREVRTPDDLDGLVMSTLDRPVQVETTRAFGALPRVDGPAGPAASDDPRSSGVRAGIFDLLARDAPRRPAHLTLDRHSYLLAFWLMNDRSYGRLPRDLQPIVQLGFDELTRLTLRFPEAREAAALAAFEAAGGRVYVPSAAERRAFVRAGGRVSTWFMADYGADWLVWLEGAIAEAEREIALSATPGRPG